MLTVTQILTLLEQTLVKIGQQETLCHVTEKVCFGIH